MGDCHGESSMDRISEAFLKAQTTKRACFIAYVCAGDPNYDTSLEVCRTLLDSGVDILEIGVPFSDPLADGLTNQLAAQRALEAGMTQEKVFELVKQVRKFSQKPIVFYTYYNLVFSQDERAYAKRAAEAGVDGMLVLDLPPEESGSWQEACREAGLKTVFIIAPTTPPARMELIAKAATGFIYYVSREGVTGERSTLASSMGNNVAEIRKHTSGPVVVGFGISNREHAAAVAAIADGVVVGSAIVNVIASGKDNPDEMLAQLRAKVTDFSAGCGK